MKGNATAQSSRSPSRGIANNTNNSMATAHSEISFAYIGRARAHTAPISGIVFGFKDGIETLISISEDQ